MRRIGRLNNKPVVEGDPNELKKGQLLAKIVDDTVVELQERTDDNTIVSNTKEELKPKYTQSIQIIGIPWTETTADSIITVREYHENYEDNNMKIYYPHPKDMYIDNDEDNIRSYVYDDPAYRITKLELTCSENTSYIRYLSITGFTEKDGILFKEFESRLFNQNDTISISSDKYKNCNLIIQYFITKYE